MSMSNDNEIFAGVIERLTEEEAAWCRSALAERRRGDSIDEPQFGWDIETDEESGFTCLYVYEADDAAVAVARFVQTFLRQFRPTDCWWMTWASVQPRLCTGGGVFVTAEKIESVAAHDWASERRQAFLTAQDRRSAGTEP
jgi:hypothetical protein